MGVYLETGGLSIRVSIIKSKKPRWQKESEYLVQLHSYPANSGAIERIFSTFGLVCSLIRNWLSTEKAQKLVRIHRLYRT